MAKVTEGEKLILEKLDAIEGPISSEDLSDLRPKTMREHLLVMLPVQAGMLERLEKIEKTLKDGGLCDRVTRLETALKWIGLIGGGSLLGLALRAIFG